LGTIKLFEKAEQLEDVFVNKLKLLLDTITSLPFKIFLPANPTKELFVHGVSDAFFKKK
jgi:hypothetical protein